MYDQLTNLVAHFSMVGIYLMVVISAIMGFVFPFLILAGMIEGPPGSPTGDPVNRARSDKGGEQHHDVRKHRSAV